MSITEEFLVLFRKGFPEGRNFYKGMAKYTMRIEPKELKIVSKNNQLVEKIPLKNIVAVNEDSIKGATIGKIDLKDGFIYSFFARQKTTGISNKKTKKIVLSINQAISKLDLEEIEEEAEILDRIKKMLDVSSRIKIDMMRDALDLEENLFNKKLFDWAAQFGFTIDGDYLVINQDSIDDFINELDASFAEWSGMERGKVEKKL